MRYPVRLLLFVCPLAVWWAPALAQSTNAAPTIVTTTTALDPASVPLASDADKKGLTDYLGLVAKSPGENSALTAGADMAGLTWYFDSPQNPSSIADTVRVALELCEFDDKSPCIVLSVNGHDARDTDGRWPDQPHMLETAPGSRFNPWTLPFNSEFNRALGGKLGDLAHPSAVVVSNGAGWSSGTGKTILEAIDTAFASCVKIYPNNTCVLYSVNGTVVMAQ